MARTVVGLFEDSKAAGDVVGDLKNKGYTKEISVLAHNEKVGGEKTNEVKQDVSAGATAGATVGAIAGVVAAFMTGITSLVVPGIGLLVGGPLMAALGVTGGAIGMLAGGIVGALVDLGMNEATARIYEQKINEGQVLVGVTTDNEAKEAEVTRLLEDAGATDIATLNK
jgi:uncharacterized membrane protein